MEEVSATEAARSFSDLLNRVRYRGETFEVVRGGEVVARLVPASRSRASVSDLFSLLNRLRAPDPAMADDLERIQESQPPMPRDPWGT
jgi:prevent-host-death family protein